MNKIIKFAMNTTLAMILLSILLLPTGFMGIMNFEENPTVLSSQDERGPAEPTTRFPNDPEANIPQDVEEMIMMMERDYYGAQIQEEDTGNTEDIEVEDTENSETNLIQE